jgi:hypothetical protein
MYQVSSTVAGVWCDIQNTHVTGNLCIPTYISCPPPPFLWKGEGDLYPVYDLAFGVQQCHIKFIDQGYSNSNVMREMDKQEYKDYIPCIREQGAT